MAARRHNHIPPYELMARRGQGPGPASEPEQAKEPPSSPKAHVSPWWIGSTNPIVLRVPRGMAVLAIVVMLGLLTLAYFVGYEQRGNTITKSGSDTSHATGTLSQPPVGLTAQDNAAPSGEQTHPTAGVVPHATSTLVTTTDSGKWPAGAQRKAGLNYLRLALYPLDSAKQLQAFMAKRGLNTVLDKKGSNSYAVIVVNLGVKHIGSDQAAAWKAHCRQLGREWGKYLKNNNEDLRSMYYVHYP